MLKSKELDLKDQDNLVWDYLKRLNSIYRRLPEFDCGDCQDCENYCIRPVVFLLEFENIFRFVDTQLSAEQKTKAIKKAKVIHHSRQLYRKIKGEPVGIKCVFRDNLLNKCIIYPVRPMACRIFGLQGIKRDQPVCKSCRRDCEKIKIVNNQDFDCSMISPLYSQVGELSRLFKEAGIDELCNLALNVHILDIWISIKYVDSEEAKKEFGGLEHKRLLEIALKDPCLKNRKKQNIPRYYAEPRSTAV